MKTEKYIAVVGVNPGYNGVNSNGDASGTVAAVWQKAAREEFENSGIYVSAVVSAAKTVYNVDWGCPIGGEETAVVTVTRNSEFAKDADKFRAAVFAVVKTVKAELKQSTVTVEETATDLTYLKNTYNRIFEYIEKIQNKLKVSESEAKESTNLYLDLYDAVASKDPQNAQYDQNKELLEKIFPEKKCFFEDKPEQLDSVASEEKDSDDYGWLDPSGKFYPVEWGNHLSFAVKYVDDNFHSEFEEWSKKEKNCDREDFLIYSKGWILLHNPSTGIAFPTADPKHRTTKPQKEFLFDYYMKRNSPNKANMYYKDEN